MENCTASLIVIGDEILRGQISDTNTFYLAKSLRAAGVKLQRVTVIPDIVDEIAQTVRDASEQYNIVFTSGGVGPTHDDVTYKAVSVGLQLKFEPHEELVDFLAKRFPCEKEAQRLAVVPKPCEIIYVNLPKRYAVIKAKNVYMLPGSPTYFEPAIDAIIPTLEGSLPLHFEYIDVEASELSIVKFLDEHAERWKDKVTIGSYPQKERKPFTRITLEGKVKDVSVAREEFLSYLLEKGIQFVQNSFGEYQAMSLLKDVEQQQHVRDSLNIVRDCYKSYKTGEIFVSFNGGKDCTVVLHLAAAVAKLENIPILLFSCITKDPFPEVDSFVEQAARYYGLELIRKEYPLRSALTSLLKEKPKLKATLMGTRKGDPGSEHLGSFTPTDSDWPKLMRVNPILNWTYEQVWQFLLKYNVPYCSLYDQGYTSIGTRATTVPNPALKDPVNPSSYFPAYTLTDDSVERQGRV